MTFFTASRSRLLFPRLLFPLLMGLLLLFGHSVRVEEDETTTAEDVNDTAEVTVTRVVPRVTDDRHQALIDHLELLSRGHEVIQLVAAEESFNGLYLPDISGEPQGGVLLLHNHGQHGHWPSLVGPLREYLTQYGWSTFSIELPDPPPPGVPDRSTADASSEPDPATDTTAEEPAAPEENTEPADTETTAEAVDSNGIALSDSPEVNQALDNEPALPRLTELPALESQEAAETETTPTPDVVSPDEAYRNQVRARVAAGVNYLNQRGQFNIVVIASGSSAPWAVDFMNQLTTPIPDEEGNERGYALVLLDPTYSPQNPIPFTRLLGGLDLPVLDLVTGFGSVAEYQSTIHAQQQRAGLMKRRDRNQYRQIRMSSQDDMDSVTNQINRRVRGWLKTNAAGTQIGGG